MNKSVQFQTVDSVQFKTARYTGWERVDETLQNARTELDLARSEDDYQSVGLRCREILISLAQAVYDEKRHGRPDETRPSEADAKRMLEAYISSALAGGRLENLRKHVRTTYQLTVDLQHRRSATLVDAALTLEATRSVVNLVAIISGVRQDSTALLRPQGASAKD